VNGNTVQNDAAGTSSYAINQDCTGTLTFSPSGLTFDLFIAPNGSRFDMIETVTGTVLVGVAEECHFGPRGAPPGLPLAPLHQ
jgi:hypothetical protein